MPVTLTTPENTTRIEMFAPARYAPSAIVEPTEETTTAAAGSTTRGSVKDSRFGLPATSVNVAAATSSAAVPPAPGVGVNVAV